MLIGSVQRVAVLSLHTSPLAQPGSGDSGGMNVYVRELAASLAFSHVERSRQESLPILAARLPAE